MDDKEKSCWMKIWLRANFSSNIFTPIQQNFYVWLVYSLFHPKFHSYDVISTVRTSNFEWFNKTKTLCKLITIKNHTPVHIKSKWPWTATKKILTIYLNFKNKMGKMQQKKLKIAEKEKASRPKKVYKKNRKKERLRKLSTLVFYLGVAFYHQSLQALTVSLAKACLLPSLIWHWMKEWIDLRVEWNILDGTYKRYKLSSNILPTFTQNFIQHVG